MRPIRAVQLGATAIAVIALLRQRREARAVRRGDLRGLGAAGASQVDRSDSPLHARVASWAPTRPRTEAGRALTALWAAPITAVGLLAAALGRSRPVWDADAGVFLARSVTGPTGWFLAQQGAAAATLGQVVLARGADVPRALLVHEVEHTRQQERLGLLFGLAYPLATARWGYRDNPFEVAARRAVRSDDLSGPAGPA